MTQEPDHDIPFEIARRALYKIAMTDAWKPIGGSVVAAIQHEARQALGEIEQAEARSQNA